MTLTNAPILETDRLILRGPLHDDAAPLMDFLCDRDRAEGFGAYDNRSDAWRWFALNVGHWHFHGYGYFTIVDKASNAAAGIAGIWNPHGWPEPELGWVVFDGFEGKGIAYEAALRAREWAYAADGLGFSTLTSNIVPGNDRSIALAERLGAWFERKYQNVHMGEDLLYRHPSPTDLESDGSVEAYA
ncbi:Protein N-acetyltransferase, RimJ/RimL family [Thalassovita litoralis]|jgi:RimJ/RimL family protein N-acetyltransferase|uniref:Protein N-acetyltransferase, RimJ/RimL family n=1 Tax=Thalassovita litoralis TaxID=1010611 RepID=A0A521EGW3_9RHOB|nr:GNAT family N-acetyltransferase [Thalassovita litoralis]SMO82721.1 Protein N-acetyltransferase, RimJ/RimL family [Thalassovita litoralis]